MNFSSISSSGLFNTFVNMTNSNSTADASSTNNNIGPFTLSRFIPFIIGGAMFFVGCGCMAYSTRQYNRAIRAYEDDFMQQQAVGINAAESNPVEYQGYQSENAEVMNAPQEDNAIAINNLDAADEPQDLRTYHLNNLSLWSKRVVQSRVLTVTGALIMGGTGLSMAPVDDDGKSQHIFLEGLQARAVMGRG